MICWQGQAFLQGFHKIAHLFLCADIALRQKLAVGRLDCDLTDFQMHGQSAFGGELFSRAQPPG